MGAPRAIALRALLVGSGVAVAPDSTASLRRLHSRTSSQGRASVKNPFSAALCATGRAGAEAGNAGTAGNQGRDHAGAPGCDLPRVALHERAEVDRVSAGEEQEHGERVLRLVRRLDHRCEDGGGTERDPAALHHLRCGGVGICEVRGAPLLRLSRGVGIVPLCRTRPVVAEALVQELGSRQRFPAWGTRRRAVADQPGLEKPTYRLAAKPIAGDVVPHALCLMWMLQYDHSACRNIETRSETEGLSGMSLFFDSHPILRRILSATHNESPAACPETPRRCRCSAGARSRRSSLRKIRLGRC